MTGLVDSKFTDLTCYTEVIQDCMFDLIDAGKVTVASGTSFTPSSEGLVRLIDNMDHYAKYCILRPMEISNHPETARRLGVIAMNTAIEVDMYGHINSTNIMGSRMMNGLGGSGDLHEMPTFRFLQQYQLQKMETFLPSFQWYLTSIIPNMTSK